MGKYEEVKGAFFISETKKPARGRFLYHYHLTAQAVAVIAIVSIREVIGNYSATTLAADGPLAPLSIENSTF